MTVLLHNDMILAALAPLSSQASLDAAGRTVYRCAEQNMTVQQTVAACRMDQEIVEQSVCELISLKMIVVRPPEPQCSPEEEAFIRELETFHAAARESDYYDLLGVEPDTPRAEMRNRYFELSKRFHPDKAFGRAAKNHKDKMSFIFNRLTQAYDILSNAKKRSAYNESIADQLELRALERQLKAAVAEKKSVSAPPGKDATAAPQAKEAASFSNGNSSPKTATTGRPTAAKVASESRASATKVNAKKPRPEPRPFSPSVPPTHDSDARRSAIRRRRANRAVEDLLRRRSSDSPTPPPAYDIDKQIAEAETAFKQERFTDAVAAAKLVLEAVPKHARATALLREAAEAQGRAQAQMHLRRGHYATREGQFKEAKWHLEQAAATDKKNTDARHLLAQIKLQQERDCIGALALMKEVIVLGGQRSRYFATLGDIFLEMKDMERAKDAFNKALRLDADNKELKKKLRLCKK